jgi:hypothetical protein
VGAGSSDDERPLGELLTAHVAEIDLVDAELGEKLFQIGGNRLGRQLAGENADRLGQAADAVHFDAFHYRRFTRVGHRH